MSQPNKTEKTYLSGHSRNGESSDWPQPIPLRGVNQLPDFPTQALPPELANMVAEIADRVQIPADVPGMAALTVASSASVGRYKYLIEDHYEHPPIWTCTALGSGERKTGAFELIAKPLWDWQSDQSAGLKQEIDAAREIYFQEEARLGHLRKKASSATNPNDRDKARDAALELVKNRTVVPLSPNLISQDATPEAIPKELKTHRNRLIVLSDEGGWFSTIAGRYNGIPNVDAVNKAYGGSPIIVHRSNSDPVELLHPHLSVGLTVQPHILRKTAEQDHLRGSGFFARFAFGLPKGRVGTRLHRKGTISVTAQSAYHATIQTALGAAPLITPSELRDIILHPDAYEVWRQCHDAIEIELSQAGRLASIPDWGSKLPGQVARIAGAFHVLRCGSSDPTTVPICAEDMARAVEISKYLEAHAIGAFGLIGMNDRYFLASKILGWISDGKHSSFKLSRIKDTYRHLENDDIRSVIELLVEHNYVREVATPPRPGAGRKPSPIYEANPRFLNPPTAPINTINTFYSSSTTNEAPATSAEDSSERTRLRI